MVKEKYAKDCQQNVFLIHMKSRLCLTLHFLSGNEEFEEKKPVKITIWVIKLLSIESDSDCNQICAIFIKSMCNITLVQYKVSWQMAINMYLCNNYILLYFFIFWATAKGQTKKYSENLQPLNISKYNKRFSRFNVPEKSAKRPAIGIKMCNVPKM